MKTKSISQLRQMLDQKEISSVEVVEEFKQRIETYDKELNAFITQTFDQAIDEAKRADRDIAEGKQNSLTGIPIAHKDLICTKGVKTTAGSKMLANFVSPYNATLVEKLNQQHVLTLGKLNLDEFAMGSTGESSYFGATKNPWDLTCAAGGSSSGSATAVSAGLVLGATATDTGGSIRQPASFCNVTGLKPSYGRVSRFGVIAFASSLDQAGVIGKSAEDCALLLEGIAGFDANDPTSVKREVPNYAGELMFSLKGKKIGVPKQFFEGLESDVAKVMQDALDVYKAAGAELVDINFNYHQYITPIYYLIATAEASSNLSRFDGIRYGHRCENPQDLEDLYRRSRGEGFGAEVKSRILMGTYALTEEMYHDYYIQGQRIRRLIVNEYNDVLDRVDFIAGPSVPMTAFKLGQDNSGIENSLFDANLIGANFAGLPALNHPVGFVNGMPIGFQLIGKAFDEATILAAAHQYQQETDWHTKLPEKFS